MSLILLVISCTDQGCIEADDFGEYESETIEILASSSQDNCKYIAGAELNDESAQGTEVIKCFKTSSGPFYDEKGTGYTSDSGCIGLKEQGNATAMQICIDQCIQLCQAKMSIGVDSEPSWQSTNKRSSNINYGVTIRPGSEISIRATGNVFLGDEAVNPDLFIGAQDTKPASYDQNWGFRAFDVRSQQSLNVSFSGKMFDGENDIGAGNKTISESGNTADDAEIFNGVRRLISYVIPHPAGYDFNTGASSEKAGAKNVPLLSDPVAWGCTFTGVDEMESDCKSQNDGYTSNNYTHVDDYVAGQTFPISSNYKTAGLGTYGGVIRWKDDPIGSAYDGDDVLQQFPNCGSLPCSISPKYPYQGAIVGDLTNQITISNPSTDTAYKVSFKSMLNGSDPEGCHDLFATNNNELEYYIVDENDIPVHEHENTSDPAAINAVILNIENGIWTSQHITLEPKHKIKINNISLPVEKALCGGYIAAKLVPYHEITIYRSGFAKFAILDAISGSCDINARIINPEGSHSFSTFSENGMLSQLQTQNAGQYYEPDFYEYGRFNENGKDPLENLTVSSANITGWTKEIYVRKGQKIRFSPDSWNQTFTTNAGNRRCGVGMAMYIYPKPALLCRGKSSSSNPELVNNPQCIQDYTTETKIYNGETVKAGTLIGCFEKTPDICNDQSAYISCVAKNPENPENCDDQKNSNFCPSECVRTINCDIGTKDNNYQKVCSLDTNYIPYEVTYLNELDVEVTETRTCDTNEYNCSYCESERKASAELAAKIQVQNIDKCYDLENYKGKVSNIDEDNGFISEELENEEIAKGATTIPFFNSSYGNFEDRFYDTGDKDGNNTIFSSKSPLLFSSSSRLQFFVIDNNKDFNDRNGALDSTSSNSSPGSGYNEQNGFKISTSGMLNFSNGQWLEVALCQENSNNEDEPSTKCKPAGTTDMSSIALIRDEDNVDIPESQSYIVRIDKEASSQTSQINDSISKYAFDDYGNLVRTSSAVSGDCSASDEEDDTTKTGVDTLPGNYYYCHTYKYYTADAYDALSNDDKKIVTNRIERLRLTFKIQDPETENCEIATGDRNSPNPDGVIIENDYYDSSEESNQGEVCDGNTKPGTKETECQKQYVCVNKYNNNSGSYLVSVKVKNEVTSGISNVIGAVIEPIIKVMDGPKRNCSVDGNDLFYDGVLDKNDVCQIADVGQAERIYKLLINDPRYQLILTTSIVLMFTFFGVGYLMGVSELNQSEIVNRIIKIGVIYLFASPTGWDWFNSLFVRFFKGGSDHLAFLMASSFDTSAELKNALTNSDYYDKAILFSSVDRVFGLFFSDAVLKKISALLFASIFGWAYLLIILMSFVLYVYAVSNAVLIYLTAQIFTSILFTLGPLFFIFILFNQTKEMFDNWLKQLIGFSLQQIMILTTLAFFNMLMYEVIKMALGYKICWDEVWTINIITRISLLSFWTIASLPPVSNAQMEVGNIGNPDGIPSIFTILFIWVIASLMNKFISFMTSVASDISGGISASDLGSGVAQAAGQVQKLANSAASSIYDKTGMKERVQRYDMALFDSGKLADQNRDRLNKQNKDDSQLSAKFNKAGKKAVEEYQRKNLSELNSLSEPERQKKLNEVKDKAIKQTQKDLGVSDKDFKRIMEHKGLRSYHGSTVLGAAAQAGRQIIGGKISGDSTLSKSLEDQDAKTSYTSKNFKEASNNLTKEQRAELKEKGINVDIKRSTAGKAKKAIADVKSGKAFSDAAKAVGKSFNYAGDKLKEAKDTAARKGSETGGHFKNLATSGKRMEGVKGIAGGLATMAGGFAPKMVEAMAMSKEKKEAIKQLENEGEIVSMRKGTNLARSDAEKDLIQKRIERNKKESSIKKQDIGGKMEAMMHLDDLDEMQDSVDNNDSMSDKINKMVGRNVLRGDKKDKIREELENKHDKNVDVEIGNIQGYSAEEIGQATSKKESAQNNIKNATEQKSKKQEERKKAKQSGDTKGVEKLTEEIKEQDDIIESSKEEITKADVIINRPSASSPLAQAKSRSESANQKIKDATEKLEDLKENYPENKEEIAEQEKIIKDETKVSARADTEIKNHESKIKALENSRFHPKEKPNTAPKSDTTASDQNTKNPLNNPEENRPEISVEQQENDKNDPPADPDGEEGKSNIEEESKSNTETEENSKTNASGAEEEKKNEQVKNAAINAANSAIQSGLFGAMQNIANANQNQARNTEEDAKADSDIETDEASDQNQENEEVARPDINPSEPQNEEGNNPSSSEDDAAKARSNKIQQRVAQRKLNKLKDNFNKHLESDSAEKNSGQEKAKSKLKNRLAQRSKASSPKSLESLPEGFNNLPEARAPLPPIETTNNSDSQSHSASGTEDNNTDNEPKPTTPSQSDMQESLAGLKSKTMGKSASAPEIPTAGSKKNPTYLKHERNFRERIKNTTAKVNSHNKTKPTNDTES